MKIDKVYQSAAVLALVAASGLMCPVAAKCPVLLDPAIRHTNGIPIASSEPHRNSSVNWTCNPDKLGYCGGRYYWPCCDSVHLRQLAAAAHGCYTPPCTRYQTHVGSVCPPGQLPAGMEGIESVGMTPLGELPNDAMGMGGLGGPSVPAVPALGAGR